MQQAFRYWSALVALGGQSLGIFSSPPLSLPQCTAGGINWKVVCLLCSAALNSIIHTIIFLLEPREAIDLNNSFCVLICVGIYPAARASVELECLVSWSVWAVKEKWDSRAGEMKTERDGERLKERARFSFFAPMIPDEIDSHASWDLLLSPLSPPSRLHYIPVQRMNDLHITHEYRWPVHASATPSALGPHRTRRRGRVRDRAGERVDGEK